jgi:hypothetical protein
MLPLAICRRLMPLWLVALSLTKLQAQDGPSANLPTVGVMDFTNAAMIRRDEFSPLTMALAELLSGQLASNPSVAIVERAQMHRVLEEQGLVRGNTVDPTTAARLGKILGAQYMLFGVLVVDPAERMRLDVRAVDVSTTRVLSRHSVDDRNADDVMRLVDRLAKELHASLRLPGVQPPPRSAARSGPHEATTCARESRPWSAPGSGSGQGGFGAGVLPRCLDDG